MSEDWKKKIGGWLSQPLFWLLGLFILALFLRLYRLDTVPPGIHFDEIINGEIAMNAREEGLRIFYLPGWGREGLFHAFLSASLSLPMPVAWQMRLPSVLLSLVGLLLTYGWVRKSFGSWAALTTVAGLGISFWSLSLSRVALRSATVLPIAAGVIWLLLNIAEDESDSSDNLTLGNSPLWQGVKVALLAILMGALFYTYRASRVLPVAYAIFMAYLAIWHRPIKNRLIVAFLGALLIALPLFLFLQGNPDAELRIGQVDRPWQELLSGNFRPVLNSTLATLGMFGWQGDLADHYNLAGRPVFEPLGFALFLAGVAIAITRWRRSPYALILIWLIIGLLPGMVTEPSPHFIHTVVAMPVVFVFPGIAVAGIYDWSSKRHGLVSRYILSICLALWILGNTVWTFRDYFLIWPNQDQVRSFQQSDLANLSRLLDNLDSSEPTAICTDFLNEQDQFWRSGRQSMPFLLNRNDLDIRWFDCRSAHVFPVGDTYRYMFLGQTDFPKWLLEKWDLSSNVVDSFEGNGFRTVKVKAGTSIPLILANLSNPAGDHRPVKLGNIVEFLGYEISDTTVKPGESIGLITYWKALEQPPNDMAIFVHLMTDEGMMVGQGDSLSLLSDTLQSGDIFIQRHQINVPVEAQLGQHHLSTGIYSRNGSFPPLQVISPDGESLEEDRLILETIAIES